MEEEVMRYRIFLNFLKIAIDWPYLRESNHLNPQYPSTWCSFIIGWSSFSDRTMHSPVPIGWTSSYTSSVSTVLPTKFLSRRMLPRSGGIYMALKIEQEQGGVLESPSFPGLPHRTNGEREDPREVGERFTCAMPQILLLRNPFVLLHPWKHS